MVFTCPSTIYSCPLEESFQFRHVWARPTQARILKPRVFIGESREFLLVLHRSARARTFSGKKYQKPLAKPVSYREMRRQKPKTETTRHSFCALHCRFSGTETFRQKEAFGVLKQFPFFNGFCLPISRTPLRPSRHSAPFWAPLIIFRLLGSRARIVDNSLIFSAVSKAGNGA